MNLRDLMFNISFNSNDSASNILKMDSATDDLKKSVVGATDELEGMGKSIDGSSNQKNINGMEKATNNLDGSAKKATNNLEKLEKSFGKVGKSLMKKVTAPITALGTASIRTVVKFDDSMSKVQALLGDTVDTNELKAMRNMAKDLGSTTAHSASASADAMGILASAGYKANQILAVTPQVLSLASAGGLALEQTSGILTSTIAQFGLTAEDAVVVSDALAKAQGSSKASIDGLGESLVYAGGFANSMNMDIQKTSAFLGVLANASIDGSMAGTTFASMFKDLTGKVKNGNVQIGKSKVAVYDASGAMRDMGSIMTDVESATNGMTDAQRDAAIQAVFSGQSMKGVDAFLAQGAESYKDLEKAIYDSKDAAAEMAEEMENNIGGAFRNMGSAIEGFLLELGDVFKEDVQAIAKGIADMAKKFGKLDDGTKKMIVGALALAAAIGPIIWGGSKVMGVMGDTGKAFKKLNSPIGLTIAAIVGVIAILVNLYNTNEEFRDRVNDIWETIKTIIGGAIDWISKSWSKHGEGIMKFFKAIFVAIEAIVEVAINYILDIFSGWWKYLEGFIEFLKGVFTGDWGKAWNGLSKMVSGTIDIIKSSWDSLINLFKKPIVGVVNIFKKNKGDKDNTDVGIDGSHYSGLSKVPWNGYIGELHRNEEVLTADDPRNQNNNKSIPTVATTKTSNPSVVFNPTVKIEVKGSTNNNEALNIRQEMDKAMEKYMGQFFSQLNLQRG